MTWEDDVETMARLWNAGWSTQEIARRVYGLNSHEHLVYARLDYIKMVAKRMRRAATDFDDRAPTSPGGGLHTVGR